MSGYYPAGAEYDRNAPYNEATAEFEVSLDITVYYTTSDGEEKEIDATVIHTFNYEYCYLDGCPSLDEIDLDEIEVSNAELEQYIYQDHIIPDDATIEDICINERY